MRSKSGLPVMAGCLTPNLTRATATRVARKKYSAIASSVTIAV